MQGVGRISRKTELLPSLGACEALPRVLVSHSCAPCPNPWEDSLKHQVLPLHAFVCLPLWLEMTTKVALGSQDKGPSRCICTGLRDERVEAGKRPLVS